MAYAGGSLARAAAETGVVRFCNTGPENRFRRLIATERGWTTVS